MQEKEKIFTTNDTYLIAALESRKFPCLLIPRAGRIIGVFVRSDDLYRAINEINSDDKLQDFISYHKMIKSRMFALKSKEGDISHVEAVQDAATKQK